MNKSLEKVSRILIISAVFPPEPVISALLSRDIADALSVKHDVTVLCPHPSRPEGFIFMENAIKANYKVERLNSFTCPSSILFGRLRESFDFGKHCVDFIQKNSSSIDCIYINSWPLFSQYRIIKAARKCGVPSILHIQDIYPESLTKKLPAIIGRLVFQLLLPIDKFILKNASIIVGISSYMISYLSKTRKVEKEKFRIIRNWQNDQQFIKYSSKLSNSKNDFVFMYAGSISASAGVPALIHGFAKANLPNAKLVIAGDGADKINCINMANDLQNDKIIFSEVGPDNIAELQSEADILLLPLRKGIAKTATPSKLTAYLLSSKPVIATVEEDTDVSDILTKANCGFVVEPEDSDALADILRKSYSISETELVRMGANGKEYARMYLSKHANLNKLVSIIENTANAN